ncbi:Phosphoenolpyruvate/pyruvate domain-containing protein [Aaosphaeria arxii CBS 175.79]|uniref:Phosphoenolpyruvate/pyruvate domain-containing protein n=1 Tax=Aaosphaeria arxii CBS 175.79 TaxID=1450172 RepID=A0A6A5XZR5_9PLEO|nr:Phosphoenolpyruvate/pyruvate domain-containing protein [Aaosphaeria arxii CBS 175.79]KAF2018692.1 Phosphoenolpyruvate/pyruvate domain-containing protein [Aaosphaeria arxii CBS 175.79]
MNSLQEKSRIYQAFKRGGPSFGGWQMLPGTNSSRAIARSGVDWICVDCEHGNIDDGQMHEAVVAIAATGVSPIVRITANEPWMVKRALDAGAHGIVVPLIYTVDDAKRLVSSAKFPPEGTRGFGSPFSPQTFSNETMTYYLQNANSTLITIVQIETKSALEQVREIAALPGVDCLLIGPFDLGNNIGRPILAEGMHPELVSAIDSIKEAAHAEGKKVGIYCTSGEQSRMYAEKGFDVISIAADVLALQAQFSETLRIAQGGKVGEAKGTGAGYDGK